jgi:hypothetical protein
VALQVLPQAVSQKASHTAGSLQVILVVSAVTCKQWRANSPIGYQAAFITRSLQALPASSAAVPPPAWQQFSTAGWATLRDRLCTATATLQPLLWHRGHAHSCMVVYGMAYVHIMFSHLLGKSDNSLQHYVTPGGNHLVCLLVHSMQQRQPHQQQLQQLQREVQRYA